MKVTIDTIPGSTQTEVVIRCGQIDDTVMRMLAYLRTFDQKLLGIWQEQTFLLDPQDIYYCESVDKRTFLYGENTVYQTPLRLYELEQRLCGGTFFRASKSTLVNLAKVRAFSTHARYGGKIAIALESGERLFVSRLYVPQLKAKLAQ
nr:LytTR family DNA-binding domain-containing protein [Maliibacterium massiliense]